MKPNWLRSVTRQYSPDSYCRIKMANLDRKIYPTENGEIYCESVTCIIDLRLPVLTIFQFLVPHYMELRVHTCSHRQCTKPKTKD